MVRTEVFEKYNIYNVHYMDGAIHSLFAYDELDPMFWADSDGYNIADGRPFLSQAAIGECGKVVVSIIIFKDYKSKFRFLEDGAYL